MGQFPNDHLGSGVLRTNPTHDLAPESRRHRVHLLQIVVQLQKHFNVGMYN
jgi:hypothetical protein